MTFISILTSKRKKIESDQNPISKIKNIKSAKEGKSNLQVVGMSNGLLQSTAKLVYQETKDMDIRDILIGITEMFENSDIYEDLLLAIFVLEKFKKKFPTEIFQFYNNLIDYVDYWAVSDHLAINVAPYIDPQPHLREIQSWISSENFWRRRMALTFFLKHIRESSRYYDIVLKLAQDLIDDTSYYVRKSIPWIIREGSRKNIDVHDALINFLLKNIPRITKTELRESMRYLDKKNQKELLENYESKK